MVSKLVCHSGRELHWRLPDKWKLKGRDVKLADGATLSIPDTPSDGRGFLLGKNAAAVDAQMFHIVWFIHGRLDAGPVLIAQFPQVRQWMNNVEAVGHGQYTDMSPEDTVVVAASSKSVTVAGVADTEPQGLIVGQQIPVTPDVNGGEQAGQGYVRMVDAETIAIDRVSFFPCISELPCR